MYIILQPQRPNQLHGARKKESATDLKEEASVAKGVEGFAVKDDKVSKHQAKKNKKNKKRDAKVINHNDSYIRYIDETSRDSLMVKVLAFLPKNCRFKPLTINHA